MWLLILEWDWSTRSHAHFPPVASKRTSFKRVCLQKKVSAWLWRTHDLRSSRSSDKVKWGLRRCSSEQKWSSLHASPSTGSSISRDIASKVRWTPNTRTPTNCGPGRWKTPCKSLHWQNQISATLHRRNLAMAGGTCKGKKRGECELKYSRRVSSIKSPIISPMGSKSGSSKMGSYVSTTPANSGFFFLATDSLDISKT